MRRTVSPKSRFESAAPPQPEFVGDHDRETGVGGTGPKRRLAKPRMTRKHNPTRIDLGNRFERVERAGKPPGPGCDRAPLVGVGTRLAGPIEQGLDSILKSVVEVRIDITVIGGDERIAPRQHALDLPPRAAGTARRVGRSVVLDAVRRIVGHPAAGQCDSRVAVNRVVSLEIEPEKRRCTRCSCGRRSSASKAEDRAGDRPAFSENAIVISRRTAVPPSAAFILGADARRDVKRFAGARNPAVDLILEKPQELGPPLLIPLLRAS